MLCPPLVTVSHELVFVHGVKGHAALQVTRKRIWPFPVQLAVAYPVDGSKLAPPQLVAACAGAAAINGRNKTVPATIAAAAILRIFIKTPQFYLLIELSR